MIMDFHDFTITSNRKINELKLIFLVMFHNTEINDLSHNVIKDLFKGT